MKSSKSNNKIPVATNFFKAAIVGFWAEDIENVTNFCDFCKALVL